LGTAPLERACHQTATYCIGSYDIAQAPAPIELAY